ncbi:TIR domain-containing protein [Vibrio parahaemolyticus]|nr:TIR domain-containing protein [Vibrio parahaemolyticus]HCE1980940.1 TIR domain-containing protein [Vibrio parahaemolyticus]HCG6659683.1 TIR domain-containing protein [Vibrio parahaemolyticus]
MSLPRTFVGFSSTDIHYWRLMQAWKANKNIDFNFANCQLQAEVNSANEAYIKRKCRERINMAGKYVLLIGQDTKSKHKYVRWEAEVAIEKGCTIIGVNLDGSRSMVRDTCPPIIRDIGAIFVPFSPAIVAYAIQNYEMHNDNDNYHYKDHVYTSLGYQL